mmetsp:Transcript_13625/g.57702  ORF Transcript_13625/g.57702 Transcript_13625/m.57702 type:complete len:259 (-) Transcript_13625:255-1031(-)
MRGRPRAGYGEQHGGAQTEGTAPPDRKTQGGEGGLLHRRSGAPRRSVRSGCGHAVARRQGSAAPHLRRSLPQGSHRGGAVSRNPRQGPVPRRRDEAGVPRGTGAGHAFALHGGAFVGGWRRTRRGCGVPSRGGDSLRGEAGDRDRSRRRRSRVLRVRGGRGVGLRGGGGGCPRGGCQRRGGFSRADPDAAESVEAGELVEAGESVEAGEPDNSRQPAQTATVPFELPAATNYVEGISGEGTFVAGGVPDGITRGLLAG